MTRIRWGLVLAVVAVTVFGFVSMPPTARTLETPPELRTPIRGAIHVHTRRSDGAGTIDDVAREAAAAGLTFVILTDHGNAAREPEAPSYRHGVLCIDAVEISTTEGHVVAIGLPRSPYPLGGEARDVVEDVARLGGMSIAAHPFSRRAELQWTDWNTPIDAVEWINGDSEWRDEPFHSLFGALLTYPLRRSETLAALLDRQDEALSRWDALSAERHVVGVAASDAHARVGLTLGSDPSERGLFVPLPGYSQIFRTFSVSAPLVTLSGDARADARALVDSIRRGEVFSAIDALASPAVLMFWASRNGERVEMGGHVQTGAPLTLHVASNAPPGATMSLMRNGQTITQVRASGLELETNASGAYRVEIQLPDAPGDPPVPWAVSNPIRVISKTQADSTTTSESENHGDVRYADGPATEWRTETSPQSKGALDVVPTVGGSQISFRYALGGTLQESPFAALAMPVNGGLDGYARLTFSARANRPSRLRVHLRTTGNESQGRSWHRSVFVDEHAREVSVSFDEMKPFQPTTTGRPPLAEITDVLFAVDTVNTPAGSNGQIWLDDVTLVR